MDHPIVIVLLTVLALTVLRLLLALALAGGDVGRVSLAVRGSLRILRDPAFADKVRPLLEPPKPEPPKPVKPSGVPVHLLALMQRDGRLVDFLMEDIQSYADADVGAAVREIHRSCQAVLKEHLVLEPVLPQEERTEVVVPAGFDPSAVRLTGNVTGQPPFRGTLQHRGWRVREIKLPPIPAGQDELVLQPAEVELP